jgi:3-dehydroquinate synthase
LTEKDVVRIVAILKKSGLPVNPPNISIEKFLDLMRRDKKTKNNDIYLVLLKKIGVSILTKDYDFEKLKQVLQKKTFD